MEIWRVVHAIKRKWWLILILALLGGTIGYYLFVYSAVTTYSASSTLYVLNRDKLVAGESLSVSDINASQQLLMQYSGIFYSQAVASEAIKELDGYGVTAEQLSSMVSIESSESSNLLTIVAVSQDPQLSVAAANAMGQAFIVQINNLTQSNNTGFLDRAKAPIESHNDGTMKIIVLVLIGIIAAISITYLIEYFDTSIHSAEEIENSLKLRVIGIIPEHDIR